MIELPPIPEPERPPDWLDAFLAAHPDERARIEAARQRAAQERAVVRAIYEHHARGTPSRRGLKVLLAAYRSLLDEHDSESRRGGGGGR